MSRAADLLASAAGGTAVSSTCRSRSRRSRTPRGGSSASRRSPATSASGSGTGPRGRSFWPGSGPPGPRPKCPAHFSPSSCHRPTRPRLTRQWTARPRGPHGPPRTTSRASTECGSSSWTTRPSIALTAYARGEDRRRALDAGFQARLPKPVDPVELAETVARLVGERGQRARARPIRPPGPRPPGRDRC